MRARKDVNNLGNGAAKRKHSVGKAILRRKENANRKALVQNGRKENM